MSEITSYFDSYARVNPAWAAFVADCENRGTNPKPSYSPQSLAEMRNPDGSLQLIEVNANNYPKIYGALKEECEFRNVPMPACYVDRTKNCAWGWAKRAEYMVAVEDGLHEVCSQEELRWIIAHEVKHLYQADWNTEQECRMEEYDCDRAAVESTGYDVARSFFRKGRKLRMEKGVGSLLIGKAVLSAHNMFPDLLAHSSLVAIDWSRTDIKRLRIAKDPYYPGHAARMKAMREHITTLSEQKNEQALTPHT